MTISIAARLSAIVTDLERMDFAEEIAEMIARRERTMTTQEIVAALQGAIRDVEDAA